MNDFISRVENRFARWRDDEDASMTVEFVVIYPLLIAWIVGSFLYFDAYRSFSQSAKVSYVITDIVSRYDEDELPLDSDNFDYLYNLQRNMLPPRSRTAKLRVTSICFRDDEYRVMWSDTRGGVTPPLDPGDEIDGVIYFRPLKDADIPLTKMPKIAEMDSIILTEVIAEWHPIVDVSLFGVPMLAARSWPNQSTIRPRFEQILTHEDLNTEIICPASGDVTPSAGGS